jgi:hypothetical protein
VRLWALLALPLLTGCGVSTLDTSASEPTKNACESDAECGGGSCQDGRCRAGTGTFSTVLFEVTPPTTARNNGGVQYLKRIDQLSLFGGPQDIALDQLAQVDGTIVPESPVNSAAGAACDPSTAVFDVAITPSDGVLGLGVASYPAKATPIGDAEGSHKFNLRLPAAEYDIYVQPKTHPTGGPGCELAPQLYRRQSIPAAPVKLVLPLPPPSTLELRVRLPATLGLEGWSADIIDPETRTILSNEVELSVREGDEYVAILKYSPVIGGRLAEARELVRLRPPEGQPAPTILLERSGLEVTTPGIATVDQITELPTAVEVGGRVELAGSLEGVAGATVTVSATELDAPGIEPGVPVEYFQETTTDDQGKFNVKLLPGEYRCVAVPPAGLGYATGSVPWTISTSSNLQAGRTVEVLPLVNLTGSVLTASNAPVSGVSINAAASPASLPLDERNAPLPVAPRAGTDILDANGVFEIGAEPGTYDLSVRPTDATGFPWLVRPNLAVGGQESEIRLPALRMPLPLEYSGVVTANANSRQEPVAGALIRAYVYVTNQHTYTGDPAKAASVLQIGETRAGDGGEFKLLLPPNLE